jgi:small subunit ribosomal protein S20
MANIRSQMKRNRQNERRRLRNKSVRSEIRTRTKNALAAADSGSEGTGDFVRLAMKRIDKAAAKGIIHPNQASRRKARLARAVAKRLGEPEPAHAGTTAGGVDLD